VASHLLIGRVLAIILPTVQVRWRSVLGFKYPRNPTASAALTPREHPHVFSIGG